jgi:hypothetical protein
MRCSVPLKGHTTKPTSFHFISASNKTLTFASVDRLLIFLKNGSLLNINYDELTVATRAAAFSKPA